MPTDHRVRSVRPRRWLSDRQADIDARVAAVRRLAGVPDDGWRPKARDYEPDTRDRRGETRDAKPVTNGEREWPSATAASLEMGQDTCAVAAAIRQGTKCAGYYWRYLHTVPECGIVSQVADS